MSGNNDTFDTQDSQFHETKYRRDNMIRAYDESNKIPYPHLLLTCDKLDRYKVITLKGMLTSPASTLRTENMIDVLMRTPAGLNHIGRVSNITLKTILGNKIFEDFGKRIYTSKDTYFEGDMMYAFCGTMG